MLLSRCSPRAWQSTCTGRSKHGSTAVLTGLRHGVANAACAAQAASKSLRRRPGLGAVAGCRRAGGADSWRAGRREAVRHRIPGRGNAGRRPGEGTLSGPLGLSDLPPRAATLSGAADGALGFGRGTGWVTLGVPAPDRRDRLALRGRDRWQGRLDRWPAVGWGGQAGDPAVLCGAGTDCGQAGDKAKAEGGGRNTPSP